MSSIQHVPEKLVTWTDRNSLGLNDEWVAELVAKGYRLIDRRAKAKAPEHEHPDPPEAA